MILPGVQIGDNVVVGAKSLVNKNLEGGFVYAGVPARKIKSIDEYFEGLSESKQNIKELTPNEKRDFLVKLYLETTK